MLHKTHECPRFWPPKLRKKALVMTLFFLCGLPAALLAAPGQNPFVSPAPGASSPAPEKPLASVAPTLGTTAGPALSAERADWNRMPGLLSWLMPLQRSLHRQLSRLFRNVQRGEGLGAWILLLGAALAYGILHALGPGHGKALVSAWVLSRSWSVNEVFFAGHLTALFHGLSAMIAVGIPFFLLRTWVQQALGTYSLWTRRLSLVFVFLLGMILLAQWLQEVVLKRPHQHKRAAGGPWTLALAGGLVPCPGASLLLVFGFSLGAPALAFLSAGVMTLGMGLTISVIALGVRSLGRGSFRVAQKVTRSRAKTRLACCTGPLMTEALLQGGGREVMTVDLKEAEIYHQMEGQGWPKSIQVIRLMSIIFIVFFSLGFLLA